MRQRPSRHHRDPRGPQRTVALAQTDPPPSLARRALNELLPALVVIALTLAARSSFADHYVIPSGSMEHTLEIGDHVLVDKYAYGLRVPFTGIELEAGDRPRRGEVIIFDSPDDGTRLIKRVVAVGGDHVRIENGELYLDGHSLREPAALPLERFDDRVARLNLGYGGGPDVPGRMIPHGELLVVGDSRGNSRDGRSFGLISEDLAYGKARAVIWRRGEGLVWKSL